MLFALHGAPDLALTQVLTETVMVVVFALTLRRLSSHFSERPFTRNRWRSITLGTLVGIVTSAMAYAAAAARQSPATSSDIAEAAVTRGGGRNIVNVTLVDIRAWDTMGELAVLVAAATGVASLIYLITGRSGRLTPARADSADDPTGHHWLVSTLRDRPRARSIIFEVVTRFLFHPILVVSVWLLLTGHNTPGGGFVAGLVAGLALLIRYLAGGRHELDEAAPIDAGVVLGLGLVIAAGTALVPVALGHQVLASGAAHLTLPLLGELHLVSSTVFDIGVYLVVIGLMLDILRSLGGGIDADGQAAPELTAASPDADSPDADSPGEKPTVPMEPEHTAYPMEVLR
ncbi:hydrogen gas-evolving membrane-bound hydrogenase subunit E [Actinomycetota bacterium]